ncbi:hypothetical protein SUGI_0904900 [Cryptomeria japonica]|nr:hypothetical protein SUGI_0904900 [Cryptomeria japonica]
MEFQYEERICSVQDLCAYLMAESDGEETLSFCDMLLCDSGRIREHAAWRSDSSESKSSYWPSSITNNSQASSRSFNYSASEKGLKAVDLTAFSNKNDVVANWTSFSSGSRSKRSSGWLQFFSLGINKTPLMELEDLRLRQCKRNENGVDKPVRKQSVSSYYEERLIVKKEAATFHQRSKSVKKNKRAVQTRRTNGFRILTLLTSLNTRKSSVNSVIHCSKKSKCVERECLVPSPKIAP